MSDARLVFLAVVLLGTWPTSRAQAEEPAPSPAPTSVVVTVEPSGPPTPHTGFQFALRIADVIPFGAFTGDSGDDLSGTLSSELGFAADLGVKVTPHVYVGALLGFGAGSGGDGLASACASVSCSSFSYRFELGAQYHFLPSGWVDPWVGYAAGFEGASVAISNTDVDQTSSRSATGWVLAEPSLGVDFRLSDAIGLGPFVSYSVGRFTSQSESTPSTSSEGGIANQAFHEWLSLGLRVVCTP